MRSKTTLGIAFILFLVGLPLISLGSAQGIVSLYYLGLLVVLVGAVLPPSMRLLCWVAGTWADEQAADWRRSCNQ